MIRRRRNVGIRASFGDALRPEGGPAAFALRQAGIDAEKIAYWGSGLLTRDQYENGKTRYGPPTAGSEDVHWLTKAKELVKAEHLRRRGQLASPQSLQQP